MILSQFVHATAIRTLYGISEEVRRRWEKVELRGRKRAELLNAPYITVGRRGKEDKLRLDFHRRNLSKMFNEVGKTAPIWKLMNDTGCSILELHWYKPGYFLKIPAEIMKIICDDQVYMKEYLAIPRDAEGRGIVCPEWNVDRITFKEISWEDCGETVNELQELDVHAAYQRDQGENHEDYV